MADNEMDLKREAKRRKIQEERQNAKDFRMKENLRKKEQRMRSKNVREENFR